MVNILICDDSLFMRKVLRDILESGGYKVVGESMDGEDVINKIRLLKPDLVTIDLTMPKMTGLSALDIIAKEFPKLIIVVISALGQPQIIREALAKGADDFIIKPITKLKLLYMVDKILRTSKKANGKLTLTVNVT